jgi:hypothetical protein
MVEGRKVGLWIGVGCGIAALLAILGAVLCVGVCGAGIGGVFVATEGAAREANGFLEELRGGDDEAAYARMSNTYRQSHDLNAFRQAVERIPALRQQTGASFTGRNINAGAVMTATISGQLNLATGPVPIQLQLSQRGETWKIETITVQGQPF